MLGVIFSIIAGMAMSIQGVMNTRLSESIGTMEANAFVQCTAALFSLAALLFYHEGSFSALGETSRVYWFGGLLGLIITVTVMLGIHNLSPTVSISVILISQLFVAALIDAFGIMGSDRVPFLWQKYVGLALMVGGVGIDGLRRQITNLCGFEIDCYAVIDINAFASIVDTIGGVTFDVPVNMSYDDPAQNLSIHLSAGEQTLDGRQALGLVRFRQNNNGIGYGDLGRIETQQAFLKAAARQVLSLGNIPNIAAIIEILTQSTTTDLSASNISFFARQFLKCSGDDINFYTAPTVGVSVGGASYQSLVLSDWLQLVNERLNPTGETVTAANVNILTSDGSSFFSTSGEFAGGYGSFAGYSGGGASSAAEQPSPTPSAPTAPPSPPADAPDAEAEAPQEPEGFAPDEASDAEAPPISAEGVSDLPAPHLENFDGISG